MNSKMTGIEMFLHLNGYRHIRKIPGRGWCGIERMIFTWALWYGMDWNGKAGRYCFDDLSECKAAINEWDGTGDPPGDWIKHFGPDGEYSNPARGEK